jgi:hypothetical protein
MKKKKENKMSDRKESNIVLKKITNFVSKEDHEKIQKYAEEQGHDGYEIRANEAYALMENGDLYIIDDEGVGNDDPMRPGEKNVISLNIYATDKKLDDGISNVSIFPFGQFSLSYEEVVSLETEDVMLHDHIRKFGHRLECNYELWREKLEGVAV